MNNGYVKLHRKIQHSSLWQEKPFSRGQAFMDIVLLANYKDGFIRARGIKVPIKRGQLGWSEIALADRWGWSRGKVRRFLAELETDTSLAITRDNKTTVITVCNYDIYNPLQTADGTANDTADGTANGQQTDTNNKGKKDNKERSALISLFISSMETARKVTIDKRQYGKIQAELNRLQHDGISEDRIRRLLNDTDTLARFWADIHQPGSFARFFAEIESTSETCAFHRDLPEYREQIRLSPAIGEDYHE